MTFASIAYAPFRLIPTRSLVCHLRASAFVIDAGARRSSTRRRVEMKMSRLIGFLLCLFWLIACGGEEHSVKTVPSARRTVLVYLAGDNSLSGEVWEKVDALVSNWHNTQDNLLIYQDTRGEKGTPSLMKVICDGGHSYTEVVKEYPDANSADPQAFSEVLRDATSGFPAPSYGLLLFSHGTGWLPAGRYADPRAVYRSGGRSPSGEGLRSIINDAGREMDIRDFAAAIPDGQFDFIVLEACLMASAEVAYELRDKAGYLLASSAEILSPGFTPVYEKMLQALFTQPEAVLTEVAAAYYTYCNELETPYRSATVSVIRLDKMKELARAVGEVYHLLPDGIGNEELKNIQCFDRSGDRLFFDLASLITYATGKVDDRVVTEHAMEVLSEVILYKCATPFFVSLPIRSHSGLTVYIPQHNYPVLNTAWEQTGWGKLMK